MFLDPVGISRGERLALERGEKPLYIEVIARHDRSPVFLNSSLSFCTPW
jgi:hypothetical protein